MSSEPQETDPRCECGEVLSAHRHYLGGRPAVMEDHERRHDGNEPRRWLCRGFVRATEKKDPTP